MSPDLLLDKTIPSFFTPEMQEFFAEYAKNEYPKEAVAIVTSEDELVFLVNVSPNPTEEFQISTADVVRYSGFKGVIHSHPDGDLWPSKADMESQIEWGVPFGIVTCTDDSCSRSVWLGDHTLSIDLEGRPFVHGVFDCYSLIRSEFYQRTGELLPDFARSFEWWEEKQDVNEDMYITNFKSAGYEEFSQEDVVSTGDGVMMKIHSPVICHAAVYIGNGLILHHLRDRLSRVEHLSTWKKFIEKLVRFKG